MARPRGPQQLWPSRGQLYEAPDGGSYRDDDLRRYAGRLVRGIRTGAEPSDCVRLARIGLHSRGLERPAAHRLPVSPANHLEQAAHRFDSHVKAHMVVWLSVVQELRNYRQPDNHVSF